MRIIRAILLTGSLTYVGLLFLYVQTMEKNHMAAKSRVRPRVVNLGIVVGWDPNRPDPKGVKVTEKNIEGIADWVGGKTVARATTLNGDVSGHNVKIHTDRGNRVRVARVGDVVVKYDTDKFGVIKEANFLGFEK